MTRWRWAVALSAALIMTAPGVATAATRAAGPARHGSAVTARADGDTYLLAGPSVFGVTVQEDPLAYHAVALADGSVHGWWHYDLWQAGQETTYSGPVRCLSVSGNRAWIGGPVTASSDPSQLGMGAWWQVADNGSGRHPVVPDRTTFAGIGTMAQTAAYCQTKPDPHFIFDVQLGGLSVAGASGG